MYNAVGYCSKVSYFSVYFGNILEDALIHNVQQDLPAMCSPLVLFLFHSPKELHIVYRSCTCLRDTWLCVRSCNSSRKSHNAVKNCCHYWMTSAFCAFFGLWVALVLKLRKRDQCIMPHWFKFCPKECESSVHTRVYTYLANPVNQIWIFNANTWDVNSERERQENFLWPTKRRFLKRLISLH